MPHLVYLHGLGSSPGARKAALLRERLEPEGFSFTVPDLNVPSFARLSFAAIAEATVAAAMTFAATFDKGRGVFGEIKRRKHQHVFEVFAGPDQPIIEGLKLLA